MSCARTLGLVAAVTGAAPSTDALSRAPLAADLPLAHVFERAVSAACFHHGARMGFFQGDVTKLLDDLAVLRPTVFPSVPRLFNRVYDKIMAGVREASGLRRQLFEYAFASKKHYLQQGHVTHALWDRLVFAKIRDALGASVPRRSGHLPRVHTPARSHSHCADGRRARAAHDHGVCAHQRGGEGLPAHRLRVHAAGGVRPHGDVRGHHHHAAWHGQQRARGHPGPLHRGQAGRRRRHGVHRQRPAAATVCHCCAHCAH